MAPTKTTRTRTRSSATEPYSFEQCNDIINNQYRRQRHPSAPSGTAGRTTPGVGSANSGRNASEIASGLAVDQLEGINLEIPMDAGAERVDSTINRAAQAVWDLIISTNNMLAIIGENSFTRGVLGLLNPQQQEEIMKLTRMTIIDRKETFIRSNETNVPKLKLKLQELFTETVLRHTRGQVGLEKEDVGKRITELDNLSQQVAHKLAARDDAVNELSSSIRAAHAGIDALHKRVTQFLDNIDDDELHVGTTEHTMTMLGEILNDIVKRNAIALPSIIPEERGENDAQEIYQSDYNQIPEDVKVLFSEAEKLCFGAQQAKHEESAVIGDYTLTNKRLEIAAQQGLKQHEAQTKLKELVEFEELIRIIMLEGTFWAH